MARREPGSSKAKKRRAVPKGGLELKGGKGTKPKAGKTKAGDRPETLLSRPPSNADAEAFAVYAEKARKQNKLLAEAIAAASGERGALRGIYGAMKESGITRMRIEVLKKTLKEELRPPAERVREAREMAWQAKTLNSPAVQLGLFGDMLKEPSLEEYRAMGEHAGRQGETIDQAPGKPDSPEHKAFCEGWHVGQKENADKLVEQMGHQAAPDTPAVH